MPLLRSRAARLLAATVVMSGTTGVAISHQASATSVGSLQAQATQLASQLQTLGYQEASLSEKLDGARLQLAQTHQQVIAAQKALSGATAQESRAQKILASDAVDAYMSTGSTSDAQSAGSALQSANQNLLRSEYEQTLASQQAEAADSFKLASENHASAKAQFQRQVQAEQANLDAISSDRSQVIATAAQVTSAESRDKGQIAVLVRQQQLAQEKAAQIKAEQTLVKDRQEAAQRAAQAQAAARAAETTTTVTTVPSSPGTDPSPTTTPVTTSPPTTAPTGPTGPTGPTAPSNGTLGERALAAALTRVGDPYVWGAAGPDAFDCSGLVMWSYDQVGVSLPHYSGAQFDDTTQISMSDIQPGDLLFFSDPGEHVAMYAGNGEIIQAPYTGADVQVIPIYPELALATRVS